MNHGMDFEKIEAGQQARNLMNFAFPMGHDEAPRAGTRLGLSAGEIRRWSWVAAIRGLLGERGEGAFERECTNALGRIYDVPDGELAIPQEILEARTGATGMNFNYAVGASAPDALSFIDMLRNRSVSFRLGAQHVTDLKDDVAIPRQLSDQTLQFLLPTQAATASDASLGQVSATPKRACAITDFSEQLFRQSSADRIMMAGLANVLAVGVDLAAINGAGGVEPLGILQTTGIGTLSGTALGLAGIVGVQKTVASANGILDPNSCGYAANPIESEKLAQRQRFTSTDSPLWTGSLNDGQMSGVRAVSSKQMPAGTILYGDWSTVYVCEWGPLMLSADRGGTRFNLGMVGIRAQWFVDVICTSPASFVKITAVT